MKKIIIIDYGCGNIESIKRGFNSIGENCIATDNLIEIKTATHLILPGVGSFKNAMNRLLSLGLANSIINHSKEKKPLLGICLGMQLMFTKSYEFGKTDGLNIFNGEIIKLESNDKKKFKVPNIGWYNLVRGDNKTKNEIECLNEGKYYHVHSYYSNPVNKEKITHFIEYNKKKICVSYKENNNLGVQFHPEKSRQCGLNFLKFFSSL